MRLENPHCLAKRSRVPRTALCMRLRSSVPLLSLGLVPGAVAARASRPQLPPGVEFRGPTPPPPAAGDSGAFLAYARHRRHYALCALTFEPRDGVDASGRVPRAGGDPA